MIRKIILLFSGLTAAALYAGAAKNSYNFFMISDTHFGSAASFDAKTLDRKEIIRNIPRADRLMPQYRAIFADMAGKFDAETAFVINGGDLVKGYAKSVEAQKKEMTDAVALLREYFKIPIYSVCGNRELAWKYGRQAYAEAMLPEISRSIGRNLEVANYTVQCGPDLFIYLDYWSKNWHNFVIDTLKGLKQKPRYLFLVVHAGVLPSCRTNDLKLCDMLASRYKTIIIHGHTHSTRLIEYGKGKKNLVQFSVSTYLRSVGPGANYVLPGVDEREAGLALFRQLRAGNNAKKQQIFDTRCTPNIKRYTVWNSDNKRMAPAGYARFLVSDDGVRVIMQDADITRAPFEIKLWPVEE